MSTKFTLSTSRQIRWPNKCVVCRGNATARHEIQATGGLLYAISWYRIKYLTISYPICTKHKYIAKAIRPLMFISFFAIFVTGFVFFGEIIGEGLSELKSNSFHLAVIFLFFISIISFFYFCKLQPVRLVSEGSKSYVLVIRNDQYAREFGILNNLSEEGTEEIKRYQFHNML